MIVHDVPSKIDQFTLRIQPLVALVDEKVGIFVFGLPPFAKAKLTASMCFPWAKNVPYESFAWFTADSTGAVDLSKQKPTAAATTLSIAWG